MAEVLVEFGDPVADDLGNTYTARACGSEMPGGLWQGWIEFIPTVEGAPVRSARETTQPNRTDAIYWASGLTNVYLQGALRRALNPLVRQPAREIAPPVFDDPAPPSAIPPGSSDSVLNPFSVARKGETLLRRQLAALSAWHLVNIIRDYGLSSETVDDLNRRPAAELVELIIAGVRTRETGL